MNRTFTNKVIWITGASSGIGYHLAKELHNQGATVAISARRTHRLMSLKNELGVNNRVHIYPLDVTQHQSVVQTANQIATDLGKINIVIANAGYAPALSFEKTHEHIWKNLFNTNVFGCVSTLLASIPFIKSSEGQIVIIASILAKVPTFNTAAYSASKAALMAVGNSLYQELKGQKVSVTTIYPGMVESEIAKVDKDGMLQKNYKDLRPKFFIMPTHIAAKKIVHAIKKKKRETIITWHAKIAFFLAKYFPNLFYYVMSKIRFTSRR